MKQCRRKRIGLFVSSPENIHVSRITEGIRRRCEEYGYDLCVFASSAHVSYPVDEYVAGEVNIFELANFRELDGVILDHATLSGSKDDFVLKRLSERLAEYPDLPACSLVMGIEGTTLIENDNEETLRELCRHAIEVHGKTKLCLLTGFKGNSVAEKRLSFFLDEIEKHGLSVLPEHIVYGDFWYTSGEKLAEAIANGEVERPEAVLCASDCMAIGLINNLVKHGIGVPEDIIVIGFDSSDEGIINTITLSSYDPNDIDMGMRAVDHIRRVIDPKEPLAENDFKTVGQFHPGASCGCKTDPIYILNQIRTRIHTNSIDNWGQDADQPVSVGALMETYVLETFTASKTAEECMGNIFGSTHLLRPFSNIYLCLKENWLDIRDEQVKGYPEKMSIVVKCSSVGEETLCGVEMAPTFETAGMIPKLDEERERPGVFYFSPVHFDGKLLGYTVLERDISNTFKLNVVFRSWLRFINNALEMIRSKHRLQVLSVRDDMTGAYNRRGMYTYYKKMLEEAQPGDALFVSVVDMDSLKYINDTYGHKEGDLGIRTVCDVLTENALPNEICVRSGGDEFFLVGIGKYTRENESERALKYTKDLEERSKKLAKPYTISASIGCIVCTDLETTTLDAALSEADERMYHYKSLHKRHRGI